MVDLMVTLLSKAVPRLPETESKDGVDGWGTAK